MNQNTTLVLHEGEGTIEIVPCRCGLVHKRSLNAEGGRILEEHYSPENAIRIGEALIMAGRCMRERQTGGRFRCH